MVPSGECNTYFSIRIKSSWLPLSLFSFCVIGSIHVQCNALAMKSGEDHAYALLRGTEERLEELIPKTGAGVRSRFWLKNAFYLALVITQGLALTSLGFWFGIHHHDYCSQREERRQYSEIAWCKTDLMLLVQFRNHALLSLRCFIFHVPRHLLTCCVNCSKRVKRNQGPLVEV